MQVTRYSSKSVCVIKTRCKDTHYFFIPAQKKRKNSQNIWKFQK